MAGGTRYSKMSRELSKNLADHQINDLDADKDDDNPFEFAALAVEVKFAEHGKVVFDNFEGVFNFFEPGLCLECAGQPPVDTVEVFVVPNQVGAVENEEIFDDAVFAVERAPDEAEHIFPADMDGTFSFHLGGENADFRKEFVGALGVEVERDGVRHVEHGDFHHVAGQLWRYEAVKSDGELLAGLDFYLKVVADFFGERVFAELLEEREVFAHVRVAHVGEHHRAIIEGIEIAVFVHAVKKFGRVFLQKCAGVGFFQLLQAQRFSDVIGCDFHIWREYRQIRSSLQIGEC